MHLLIEIETSKSKTYAVLETCKHADMGLGDKYNYFDEKSNRNQTGTIIKRSDNKSYLLARKRSYEEITNDDFENLVAAKKSRYIRHLLSFKELLDREEFLLEEIEKMHLSKNLNLNDNSFVITNGIKMIKIGSGGTLLKKSVFDKIQWTSCSKATRGLLMAFFSREVLGTHSMTGKRSAAHPDKPPKGQLDPTIIEDIVSIVSERCKVSTSQVRSAITSKCADENKRRRQQPLRDSSDDTEDDSS